MNIFLTFFLHQSNIRLFQFFFMLCWYNIQLSLYSASFQQTQMVIKLLIEKLTPFDLIIVLFSSSHITTNYRYYQITRYQLPFLNQLMLPRWLDRNKAPIIISAYALRLTDIYTNYSKSSSISHLVIRINSIKT